MFKVKLLSKNQFQFQFIKNCFYIVLKTKTKNPLLKHALHLKKKNTKYIQVVFITQT